MYIVVTVVMVVVVVAVAVLLYQVLFKEVFQFHSVNVW